MPFRLINAEVAAAVTAVNAALNAAKDPQSTLTATELAAVRADLANARANVESARQTLIAQVAVIAQARLQLAAARDAGDAAAIAAAEAQLATALADRETLVTSLLAAEEGRRDAHSDGVTDMGTAAAYVHLDPQTPIVLLPVRLETRYFALDADNFSLWLRIYPDDVHVDDDQPLMSADEEEGARQYWQARLADGHESDAALAAWQALCNRFGEGRALWLASELDPFGHGGAYEPGDDGANAPPFPTPALAPDGWADPARARALPDRWAVVGYREENRVLLAFTGPVEPDLRLSPEMGAPGEELAGAADAGGPDAGIRWLTDFNEAEQVGMAVRITVNKTIARSMDRIVVFGVRASETPADSGATTASLFSSHAARSLHFVPPLSPTNNTDTAQSAYSSRDEDHRESHDRLLEGTSGAGGESYLDRTVRALGLPPDVFRHARHAGDVRERYVKAMHRALWTTTFGTMLSDHLEVTASAADTDFVRDLFVRHVRPAGALPCLRVGPQPYGLLPVVSLERWRSQLTGDAATRETILVNLLRTLLVPWRVEVHDVPRLFDSFDPQYSLVEALSLAPTGYVEQSRNSSWQTAQEAADMEQRMSGWWSAVLPLLAQGVVDLKATYGGAKLEDRHSFPLGYRNTVEDLPAPAPPPPLVASQDDKSQPLLGNYVAALAASPQPTEVSGFNVVGVEDRPVFFRLLGGAYLHYAATPADPYSSEFFDALTTLQDVDVLTLEELCSGAVDSATHRLDAWMGAVVGRRLDEVRAAQPAGVHIGGFGWIEGLEPPGEPPQPSSPTLDDPDSAGYIHLPSTRQAKTAAVLHGAHLAHADQASAETLSLQLDSDRVRLAKWLLGGLREGMTLGALLGYRLERLLLAGGDGEFIAELRAALPLRVGLDTGDAAAGLNVVDGLQALRLYQSGELPGILDPAVLAAAEPALDDLALAFDAVSDLLVAEGVHHATEGNPHRAGAAFDAMAEGGGAVPEVDVTATPQRGQPVEHRVMVVLPAGAATGWRGDPGRLRAVAEPRLNAWAAALLGDPAQIRFAATFTASDGTSVGKSYDLSGLDLCPLDLVCLSAARFETAPLVDLLRFFLTLQGPDGQGGFDGTVEVQGRDPKAAAGIRDLDAVMALAFEIKKVLETGRALNASHLRTAGSDDGVVASELTTRESAVLSGFQTIRSSFDADPANLQSWWRAALLTGPVDPRESRGTDAMLADLAQRSAKHQAVDPAGPEAAVAKDRIAALLGQDFLLLPTFDAAGPEPLDAGFADQASLLDGGGAQLKGWLEDYARVRPGCEALDMTLTLAELDGGPTTLLAAQLPYLPGRKWIGQELLETGAAPRLSVVAHLPFPTTLAQGPLTGILVDAFSEVVPNATAVTGVTFHYDAPKARAPQSILLAFPPDPDRPWEFEDLEATVLETLELAKVRGVEARDLPKHGNYLPAVYLIHGMEQDI